MKGEELGLLRPGLTWTTAEHPVATNGGMTELEVGLGDLDEAVWGFFWARGAVAAPGGAWSAFPAPVALSFLEVLPLRRLLKKLGICRNKQREMQAKVDSLLDSRCTFDALGHQSRRKCLQADQLSRESSPVAFAWGYCRLNIPQ